MRTAIPLFGFVLLAALIAMTAPATAGAQPPVVVVQPPAPGVVIQPPIVVDLPPSELALRLFEPPAGLTMNYKRLLWELGYLDSETSIMTTPLTYRVCLELAVKCHVQHRYLDSLAFARRASELSETASALYLKGLNEIALGLNADSVATVVRLKSAMIIKTDYSWLREKMSGPLTGRMNALLEVL